MEKFIRTKVNVNFRTGPGTSYTSVAILPTGTVVEVLADAEGTWYQGKLADGRVGFITSLESYVEGYIPPWLELARKAIDYGATFLDTPYVYGSARGENSSFDCSDFVQTVFKYIGIRMDGNSRTQANDYPPVPAGQPLRTGDVVFFANDVNDLSTIYHVAIYVHDDKILHTYNNKSTTVVYNEDLVDTGGRGGVTFTRWSGYWKDRAGYCLAIRPIQL